MISVMSVVGQACDSHITVWLAARAHSNKWLSVTGSTVHDHNFYE